MPLREPFAAYNAANNVEAQMVKLALRNNDIEAYATEDFSAVGYWLGGAIPEIHKPQVWIERADIDRAGPILADFERRAAQLRSVEPEEALLRTVILVVCDKCGATTPYPMAQRGSVQLCCECHGYVDVEDPDADDEEALDVEPVDETDRE